jgi:hypothetical protein
VDFSFCAERKQQAALSLQTASVVWQSDEPSFMSENFFCLFMRKRPSKSSTARTSGLLMAIPGSVALATGRPADSVFSVWCRTLSALHRLPAGRVLSGGDFADKTQKNGPQHKTGGN